MKLQIPPKIIFSTLFIFFVIAGFSQNNKIELLENYKKNVIDERNVLAHAKYFKEGDSEFLENINPEGEPIKFDSSKCKSIRKILNDYKNSLRELQKKNKQLKRQLIN